MIHFKYKWLTMPALAILVCLTAAPASSKDFPEISAEQLKAKIDAGEKLMLLNALSDIEFNDKHIPGSINIPLQEIMITRKLPKEKNQLVVTYCLGRKWMVSVDAAGLVAKRGYTHIMVFRDGLPAWIKAGYPVNSPKPLKQCNVPMIEPGQLKKSLNDYIVVDIRPKGDYKHGYLPESRAMPLAYLSTLSVELPKDGNLVVVDHKGTQCKTAAQWLKDNGFSNVCWLKGGLVTYAKAGYELETD